MIKVSLTVTQSSKIMLSSLLAPTTLEAISHVRESIKFIDIHYLNYAKRHFQHIHEKKKTSESCEILFMKITSVLFYSITSYISLEISHATQMYPWLLV